MLYLHALVDHPGDTSKLFEQLISLADKFMSFIYVFASDILWFITTDVRDVISYYDPLNISGIFSNVLFEYFEQYSILELFFGVGIGVYLIWQLIAWILNILP